MSNETTSTNSPPKALQGDSREWEVILWCDNPIHMENFVILLNDRRCVGCLHDRDENDDGEIKKPHYHFLIKFNSPTSLGSVLKVIPNQDTSNIRKVKSFRSACRYLIHLDNPEKAQYNISELVGNREIAKRYLHRDKDEADEVRKILNYINNAPKNITDFDVLMWCCDEDLYSTYRRSGYILSRVLEEKRRQ